MLLAIDSSSGTTVALLDDEGAVLAEAASEDPRGHAERIGPLLASVLDGVDRRGIDAVAYGVGPGPYTGLRVGMAAARTAALALDAVELPVLSHDAVALRAVEEGLAPPFVVVADAKRRERFFTAYSDLDGIGLPLRDGEPQVGGDDRVPALPRVERSVRADDLGRLAQRRRAAGIEAEAPGARYLRSADVTPAAPKRVLA